MRFCARGATPAVILLQILILCSCAPAGEAAPAAPGPPASDTGAAAPPITRGDFRRELMLTGELESVRSVSIKAPQTSVFQMRIQFMAEEGSFVREGEPILTFDNSALAARVHDLETSILDAETQIVAKRSEVASALKDLEIEIAEKEYEEDRTKLEASVDPEVLSRKEYGERQLAWTKARRELDETRDRITLTRDRGQADVDVLVINRDKLRQDLISAKEGLDLLAIEAPADGLVVYQERPGTTLRFQEGDSCWPGQEVMRLPDLTEMQVVFLVSEVDAPLLREGMPVVATLDAFPGRTIGATIRMIPSMAVKRDEESRIAIFRVIASLSGTWVGEMKPGMSVLGRIVIDDRKDAPIVSRAAVRFDGSDYRVGIGDPAVDDDPIIHPIARNATHYLIPEDEFGRLAGTAPPGGDQ